MACGGEGKMVAGDKGEGRLGEEKGSTRFCDPNVGGNRPEACLIRPSLMAAAPI